MAPYCSHMLTVAFGLLLLAITSTSVKGLPPGLEFKSFNLCGPHDEAENVKLTVHPWPFLPSEKPFNFSIEFTPAVDIFATTVQYEVKSEPDGRILTKGRDDVCHKFKKLCNLPSGEKFVWNFSDTMRVFPPGFKMTFNGIIKLYNEDQYEFFCAKIVATIH